jgi:osmotically-inducible protein OsmY
MFAHRLIAATVTALATLSVLPGCAVTRGQETVGEYIDDATITTQVKARFAEDPTVSAMAIKVETLKGVVQLSGFAKTSAEREKAATLAANVNGVARVVNDIMVK